MHEKLFEPALSCKRPCNPILVTLSLHVKSQLQLHDHACILEIFYSPTVLHSMHYLATWNS